MLPNRLLFRTTCANLLSSQCLRVLRDLVVKLLDRLGALCRFRFRHYRLDVAAADRQNGVVLRLHVDANAECGAAVLVARCVRRFVDGHHVSVNDLQSDDLRATQIGNQDNRKKNRTFIGFQRTNYPTSKYICWKNSTRERIDLRYKYLDTFFFNVKQFNPFCNDTLTVTDCIIYIHTCMKELDRRANGLLKRFTAA